jgi:hypothetical protein
VQRLLPFAEPTSNNAIPLADSLTAFIMAVASRCWRVKARRFCRVWVSRLPTSDWEISPTTPWNYGLFIDRDAVQESIHVTTKKPGKVPFAQESAPVVLKLKGRAIPGWVLVQNSAGQTPPSPVTSDQPDAKLELIPYGSTRLRITEFPVIAK